MAPSSKAARGPLERMARASLRESASCLARIVHTSAGNLAAAAEAAITCVQNGGTIYFCGNGGSAADAQHLACELAGRYLLDRPALPAIALTTNSSSLTAIGNDFGYAQVFSRQLEGVGRRGDVLVAITTSGNSDSVLRAVDVAKRLGMTVIGMTGARGARFAERCDFALVAPSFATPRVQEGHIAMGHTLCELVERALFSGAGPSAARPAAKPRAGGTKRAPGGTTAAVASHSRPREEAALILALIESLRPGPWTKNLLLFAGVLFSQQMDQPTLVLRAAAGFLVFSLLAGCTYLFNDLNDVESDRQHPRKRLRPIASGRLSPAAARIALVPLLALAGALSVWLGTGFVIVAGIYLALNAAYSAGLKSQVLIDVFVIALGFVLRAIAGVELLQGLSPGTAISPWLLVCTFFGALFLALAKRRRELQNAGDGAAQQRRVLEHYTPELVDGLLLVSAATSVMGYALYTIWPSTVAKFRTEALLYTVPFVAYGIFRYLYLLGASEMAEDPSQVLLTDRPMAGCVLAYLAVVVVILYRA